LEKPDTPAQLKARALRHLVRREHSRAELVRKLQPHAESVEAVQALLDQLASSKQLSDERYAEGRVRTLSRKYGSARIRDDLRSKGVSDQIVTSVSSEGELERAKAILARKYREPAATPEERARRARFLQSRGFPMELIARLLRGSEEFA
jgi:regulatory protein